GPERPCPVGRSARRRYGLEPGARLSPLAEELPGLAAEVDIEVAAGPDDGVAAPAGPGDLGRPDRPAVGAGDQGGLRAGVEGVGAGPGPVGGHGPPGPGGEGGG